MTHTDPTAATSPAADIEPDGETSTQTPHDRVDVGEPRVETFRQILLWPLGIERPDGEAGEIEQAMQDIADALKASPPEEGRPNWTRIDDPLDHVADPESEKDADGLSPFAYQEYVYFHDFVSRFLFADADETPGDAHRVAPMSVFRGADPHNPDGTKRGLTSLTADIRFKETYWKRQTEDEGGKIVAAYDMVTKRFDARVERLNLYLFRTGVAIIALEIDVAPPRRLDKGKPGPAGSTLSIDEVLAYSDQIRRAYIPFFDERRSPSAIKDAAANAPTEEKAAEIRRRRWVHGGAPEQAGWNGGTQMPPQTLAEAIEGMREGPEPGGRRGAHRRVAPLLPHWCTLLPASLCVDGDGQTTDGPVFRHLVDERMPVMSFVQFDQTMSLSAMDAAPDGTPGHWRGRFMRLCFIDAPGTDPLPYSSNFMSYKAFRKRHCYDRFLSDGTRFMISPYSFVMIGTGDYFTTNLLHHFRRMYFQLMLLSVFEFGTLVEFSSRVSRALARHERVGEPLPDEFRKSLLKIHQDFLAYVHRFRFTGVSNQVQPRELHDSIRREMGLGTLYEDVRGEIEAASSFLRAQEAERRANEAERIAKEAAKLTKEANTQTRAAGTLNLILSLGVVAGLAISTGSLFVDGLLPRAFGTGLGLALFAGVGAALALMAVDKRHLPTIGLLRVLLSLMTVTGAVMALVSWFLWSPTGEYWTAADRGEPAAATHTSIQAEPEPEAEALAEPSPALPVNAGPAGVPVETDSAARPAPEAQGQPSTAPPDTANE